MSLSLSCRCNETHWTLSEAAPARHLVCYCIDCQSFARHLGQAEILDENGGTHLVQTVPAHLHILRGEENLRALRLSPKGLLRWYTACCNTPVANTLPKSTLPFVGLIIPKDQVAAHSAEIGPVKGRVNTQITKGKVKEKGMEAAGVLVLGRAIGAKLSGRTASPFFDETGAPIREPKVLSLAERNAARGMQVG